MKKDLYIFNNGELKRKNNTVLFIKDKSKKYVPINDINSIHIFSEVSMNKRFFELIAKKEILTHYYNYYGYYIGSFYPREYLNSGTVIIAQAKYYYNEKERLGIAKEIIRTATNNIKIVLQYYSRRQDVKFDRQIEIINDLYSKIDSVKSISNLMAIEGNIREIYYTLWNDILNKKEYFFVRRTRRPPKDKINALISFGNTLLYTTVLSEIYQTQLDPRIGYLHTSNDRSFSLNLDIAEVFKPIIVDRVIFTLINKNIIHNEDYIKELNGIILNDKGRKKFVTHYNEKLKSVMKHKKINKYVSYKRLIRLEAYKIQKHILEDEKYKGFQARY